MPLDDAPGDPPGHDRRAAPAIADLGHRFTVRPLSLGNGGGYWITFPDVPLCQSWGATVGEAIEAGRIALARWLAVAAAEDRPAPPAVRHDRAAATAPRDPVGMSLRWARAGVDRPAPRLDPPTLRAAARARAAADAAFGDRLRALILFGSRVVGNHHPGHDLNVAVVLAGEAGGAGDPSSDDDFRRMIDALCDGDLGYRAAYGVYVAPYFFAEGEMGDGRLERASRRARPVLAHGIEVGPSAVPPPDRAEAGAPVEALLHRAVRLLGDHPKDGVRAGTIGTVIAVFPDGDPPAVNVEVADDDGAMTAWVTVPAHRVEVVG